MRWTPGGESSDIEDRRGSSGGFGFGGAPLGIGGIIVLLVLSLLFHRNFFALFDNGSATANPPAQSQPIQESAGEHQEVQFVSFVLDDAQNTWAQILGPQYRHAKLVLFRDAIDSACGMAQTASGPFYCPRDEKIYLDLGFFDELRSRFGANGDFAQAYVITHELGHHIQNLTGENMRESNNAYSVKLELQADCFAGIWGHSTQQRNILENGDVQEGLNAASAVGDDRIQRMSGRAVNPETFTHGSAKQRAYWFKRGFDSGRVEDCNTFSAQ